MYYPDKFRPACWWWLGIWALLCIYYGVYCESTTRNSLDFLLSVTCEFCRLVIFASKCKTQRFIWDQSPRVLQVSIHGFFQDSMMLRRFLEGADFESYTMTFNDFSHELNYKINDFKEMRMCLWNYFALKAWKHAHIIVWKTLMT
jgi:hypothetical protein